MATLNLSMNGPSIKSSYQSIVNAQLPSGAAASSPTHGLWAVFAVTAPLVSAFQSDSGKESVMKVQCTGEGELVDLIEEFSDGRIQFAYVKIKDPNTGLPKSVLIAWCGQGVPERTKGYFGSHLSAVSKILHGYHVQITARSESDLSPDDIVRKVSDASGSKYSGGPAESTTSAKPPPIASKPVFMPTRVAGGGGVQPLGRSRPTQQEQPVDADGWGADAPQVTRTQLEKVPSAYQPTKVDMANLSSQRQEPSRVSAPSSSAEDRSGLVGGGYQPVGKVDIAALRRQAQQASQAQDDRPNIVKGAYEPVGKVDIAAIRAKARGPDETSSSPSHVSPAATGASGRSDESRPVADRSAAFNAPERLTSMPKPKVSNKFGAAATFTGTKAPTPGGFSAKPTPAAPPVGAASRTFADQGGKTPAQLWAEKKAREGASTQSGAATSPIASQTSGGGSGGWQSGYAGKKWGAVQTTRTGQSAGSVSQQHTGEEAAPAPEEPSSPTGGIGALRDRFKGAPPMGAAAPNTNTSRPEPPQMDMSSKPNAGARGVPIPGLPTRPKAQEADEPPAEEHVSLPPPPAVRRSPTPPTPEAPSSPVRIAMPVGRGAADLEPANDLPQQSLPTDAMARAADRQAPAPPEPTTQDDDPARAAGAAVAGVNMADTGVAGGRRAVAQYDYEKAEDNEIELVEGEVITDIDMVDEDWWMGRNSKGEEGLFPSNYVELVEDNVGGAPGGAPALPAARQPEPEPQPEPQMAQGADAGATATAEYDYEAAEDNELSFPEGAIIEGVEFPDDDWWFGNYNGQSGLFPANYVTLNQ